MSASRYVVGIDLGTTNSALAYVDTGAGATKPPIVTLPIPQVVAARRGRGPAAVAVVPLPARARRAAGRAA